MSSDNSSLEDLEKSDVQEIPAESDNATQERRIYLEHSTTESYAGSVMHPKIANDWENLLPGAADRILTLAENEQKHRHKYELQHLEESAKLDNKKVDLEYKGIFRGQNFITAFGFVLIGFAIFATFKGFQGAAVAAIIMSFAALVGPLLPDIWNKNRSKPSIKDENTEDDPN